MKKNIRLVLDECASTALERLHLSQIIHLIDLYPLYLVGTSHGTASCYDDSYKYDLPSQLRLSTHTEDSERYSVRSIPSFSSEERYCRIVKPPPWIPG